VTGFKPERELPVVWAVAKGSFVNKLILVPAALLISAFVPQAITPLLMIGGLFLCYEGVEKLAHKVAPPESDHEARRAERIAALTHPEVDLVALERDRIRGAIRTDFILSAEIVVIALGTMATAPMGQQVVALSLIAVAITVLVYGLVAGIVKIDDLGVRLVARDVARGGGTAAGATGAFLLRAAPALMKFLSVAGTAAMFTVGGSILAHGIAPIAHGVERAAAAAGAVHGLLGGGTQLLLDALVGLVAGLVAFGAIQAVTRRRGVATSAPPPSPR
jgi:predicted DNA repair protein MutK